MEDFGYGQDLDIETHDMYETDESVSEISEAADTEFLETVPPEESEDIFADVPEAVEVVLSEESGDFFGDLPGETEAEAFEETDTPSEYGNDESDGFARVLKRDPEELINAGNSIIETNMEVLRDDLRDKGMDDGPAMEAIIAEERIKAKEEFMKDAFGGSNELPEGIETGAEIPQIDDVNGWVKEINPDFDPFDTTSEYSNNCGSCAFAVAQRLDGDMSPVASAENIGTIEEMNALTGMEQVSMSPDEIKDYLISQGEGAHGIVGVDRTEGPGHWFNAYYDGEKVVAIDGQTGEIEDWPPAYGDVVNWDISVRKEQP